MSRPRRLLILGGLALALWSMSYGFYYAVWVEHQTLDALGSNLAAAFMRAAEGNHPESQRALDAYAGAAFDYVRQVDAHSHWAGLGLLMLVLGLAFDHVRLGERTQWTLALTLLAGSAIFPLGVLLQTMATGAVPQAITALGATLVTVALAGIAFGFALKP
jgi:hypothetical protein